MEKKVSRDVEVVRDDEARMAVADIPHINLPKQPTDPVKPRSVSLRQRKKRW